MILAAASAPLTYGDIAWDVGKIVLAALLGTFLGLVIARRKIHLSLTALKPSAIARILGFSASVPAPLLDKLRKFHWTASPRGRDFQETEDLSILNDQLKETRLFLKAAELSQQTLEQSLQTLRQGQADAAKLKEIISDVFSHRVLGRMLIGMANRRTVATDPKPTQINPSSFVIQFHDEAVGAGFKGVSGYFHLEFDSYRAALPYNDPVRREAMERLAYLVAAATTPKLLDCLQKLKEELLTDITLATNIVGELEPLILANSRWVADVQITNHGQKPVILSTRAELVAKCGGKKYSTVNLHFLPDSQAKQNSSDEDDQLPESEEALRSFGVALEKSPEYPCENLFVKPSETVRVRFVSDTAIGNLADGPELLDFWKKGRPSYRLHVVPIPRGLRILRTVFSRRTAFQK